MGNQYAASSNPGYQSQYVPQGGINTPFYPYWTQIPYVYPRPGVCPGCGRCGTCGRGNNPWSYVSTVGGKNVSQADNRSDTVCEHPRSEPSKLGDASGAFTAGYTS